MHTFEKKEKPIQKTTTAIPLKPGGARPRQSQEVSSISHLQRTLGNQAVQRLLEASTRDVKEYSTTTETLQLAHDFSRIPLFAAAPTKMHPGLDGMSERAQASEHASSVSLPRNDEMSAPSFVHRVLDSPGEPLARSERVRFEPKFGLPLDRVRIHRDHYAAASASALGANAYTVGYHVVLGPGADDRSLAHELAHVAQQHDKSVPSTIPVAPHDAPTERAADHAATRVLVGAPARLARAPVAHLARYPGAWFTSPSFGPGYRAR